MLERGTPILTSERLGFHHWLEDDLDDLFRLHADPAVQTGYVPGPAKWTRDAMAESLARYRLEDDAHGITKWRLSLHDGTFVGRAGWSPWQEGRIEIGYAILPAFQGRGLAAEAANALVAWARRWRSEPLSGYALPDNAASRRILEKIGMTFVDERPIDGGTFAYYEMRDS